MSKEVDKDAILDNAIKEIVEKAFKDGIVDDKEWELINQIELSIEEYADGLNRALLDKVITPEESQELEKLRDKILKDANTVAKQDGKIDEEEAEIIQTLIKIIDKYRVS